PDIFIRPAIGLPILIFDYKTFVHSQRGLFLTVELRGREAKSGHPLNFGYEPLQSLLDAILTDARADRYFILGGRNKNVAIPFGTEERCIHVLRDFGKPCR